MKTFNNIEEMKKFYNKETNEFYIEESIELKFDLECSWDINAGDIKAWDINARDIKARDINAWDINARDINAWDINARDINARDINFYAVCFAYRTFKCKSIQSRRKNSKFFCLDSDVVIKERENGI